MTQRAAPAAKETESYTMVLPSTSPVAVTMAAEYDYDVSQEDREEA